jgi:hypothetical protein
MSDNEDSSPPPIVRQRRLTTAAEREVITQTAIRRIGRLGTAFVRLLITKALVVVTWHSSGFPSADFVKRVTASLHLLHVTPKQCRVQRHSDHHPRSLLAQFGLTPKSKRGLAASEAMDPLEGLLNWSRLMGRVTFRTSMR